MSSILAVCDEGSTHPWHETMVRNGACTPNGYEWASLAGPVTASELKKFVTFDGNVDDIERHRNGFNSPIAIPVLGVVVGFNPVGPYIPGAC